jgi:hypothetical protein
LAFFSKGTCSSKFRVPAVPSSISVGRGLYLWGGERCRRHTF